ncbi:hypothetical protein [Acidocella sp.]|uniref:hypothetical protein n=1 Tax=Acidocella sp. TaxID=50710 RepID=UPI003D089851
MLASKYIGVGIIGIGVAVGLVFVVINRGGHPESAPLVSINPSPGAPVQVVHTADWYVMHPDVLKADDIRCGSDAASIPQAACQNAATADQRLLAAQLGQAAATNAAAEKSSQQKTP